MPPAEDLDIVFGSLLLGQACDVERIAGAAFRDVLLPGTALSSMLPGDLLQGCLDAVRQLDRAGLEERLGAAQVNLSLLAFLEEIVTPLLVTAGDNWGSGKWRVAHEHLASAGVCGVLNRARKAFRTPERAPTIVTTTPSARPSRS